MEEIEFEVRQWDTGRDLSRAQLAARLFKLAKGDKAGVAADDCPDLGRAVIGKSADCGIHSIEVADVIRRADNSSLGYVVNSPLRLPDVTRAIGTMKGCCQPDAH